MRLVNPFISVCIPSYNRPKELKRLLQSIDSKDAIEIVIREDRSPKRNEIRMVVEEYQQKSKYLVRYIENEENYGYDKNIRQVAKSARGKWVIFMGDDDAFIPGALDKYANFLKNNSKHGLGYVLRRYLANYADGTHEDFRYENKDVFFQAGQESYIELFRRSVFISGFTFRKDFFDEYECDEYDGTLLFQLYIQAQICLKHPSAYCDIAITQSFEGGTPFFGNSKVEKKLYQPGQITYDNSINFLKQVSVMAEGIDRKNGIQCKDEIIKTYSKYSYGYLHEHRDDGIKVYCAYAKELKKIGFASSPYFYLFYISLLILGKRGTRNIIRFIKQILGVTPKL